MFENICTLPLSADVFTTALHPTEPLLTVGLSSGHVQTLRLPAGNTSSEDDDDADADTSVLSDGRGMVDKVWETRRHKGSCRTLAYSYDGKAMYSAGTDALIKHFDPVTGQVISKTPIPTATTVPDAPTLLHVINPQSLLLATDSGALHIYDMRSDGHLGGRPRQTHFPHSDYVSSVVPLPATDQSTSGFPKQWVSTGGTTLAVTDVRRGVIVRSDDQEDELMCGSFITGMGPRGNRNNGIVGVGSSSGVLTLWDRGAWDDQQERIIVSGNSRAGGESVDAIALTPEGTGLGKTLVCGLGDGSLRVVDLVKREVKGAINLRHDDSEGVISLGFDSANRLISAGGQTVKIWEELSELQGSGSDSDEDEEDDSDDEEVVVGTDNGKRPAEDSDSDDSDEVDQVEEMKQRIKRRKEATKAKLGPMGAHGILGFESMD